MQVSPVDALRELEPILREIETERSQQVHRFAQIALWSVVIGGLLSLGLAMFQVGAWAFAPLGIALLIIVGGVYASKASEWRNTFKHRVMTRLVQLFHPSLTYAPNRAIAEQEYHLSMLFHNSPDPDRYRGEDYIEGVIDKTDIRLSELHTEYRGGLLRQQRQPPGALGDHLSRAVYQRGLPQALSRHYAGAARHGAVVAGRVRAVAAEHQRKAGQPAWRTGQDGRPRI
jgi:hypothetical protein